MAKKTILDVTGYYYNIVEYNFEEDTYTYHGYCGERERDEDYMLICADFTIDPAIAFKYAYGTEEVYEKDEEKGCANG